MKLIFLQYLLHKIYNILVGGSNKKNDETIMNQCTGLTKQYSSLK